MPFFSMAYLLYIQDVVTAYQQVSAFCQVSWYDGAIAFWLEVVNLKVKRESERERSHKRI